MISVNEASKRIRSNIRPMPTELVNLASASGRVLAKDFVARVTHPPCNISSMDGYACIASDIKSLPTTLQLTGTVSAGSAFDGILQSGQTVRILTGGAMPDGANTVIIQENVMVKGDSITIVKGSTEEQYIRKKGLDFEKGSLGTSVGRRLGPRDLALAAAMNVPWLTVRQRPKVALISTGNEMVNLGDSVGPNQIVSSSAIALAALVRELGADPIDLGIAKDNEESLSSLTMEAKRADLIVTLGGASVGDHDIVRSVLSKLGLEIDFWQIAMRPGKPLMFGNIADTPVLGLPGNPVSSIVCGLIFVSAAIHALLSRTDKWLETITASLGRDLPKNDARQDYLRSKLEVLKETQPIATPFQKQDSSMLSILAKADCLVVRPPHAPAAKCGDHVQILPINRWDNSI